MVCLIKPQFEAGREKVGKKGVVRDASVHREVIAKVLDFADLAGFAVRGLTFSPIKGPEGNIEYLVFLQKDARTAGMEVPDTEQEAEEGLRSVQAAGTGISERAEIAQWIARTVQDAHLLLQGT